MDDFATVAFLQVDNAIAYGDSTRSTAGLFLDLIVRAHADDPFQEVLVTDAVVRHQGSKGSEIRGTRVLLWFNSGSTKDVRMFEAAPRHLYLTCKKGPVTN